MHAGRASNEASPLRMLRVRAFLRRIWFAALVIFVLNVPRLNAEPNDQYGILFITSVDPDQAGLATLIDEARSRIQDGVDRPAHFDVEYLDPYLFTRRGDNEARTAAFLQVKYAHQRFDVIIAIGPEPLTFAGKYGPQLFPGASIVSLLQGPAAQSDSPRPPGTTGVRMVLNFVPTLRVALDQNPGTRQVVLVAGSSRDDKEMLQEARNEFSGYAPDLELVDITDNSVDQFQSRLAKLEPGSVIVFLNLTADGKREEYIGARVLPVIAQAANRPMYGISSEQVGRGVVGGSVIDMREVGRAVGATALRVLKGENPEAIPLTTGEFQHYMFDAREIGRWGLDGLPPGSIVVNEKDGAWVLYKWKMIGLSLAVLLEMLLILLFLRMSIQRKHAEREVARMLTVEKLESSLAATLIQLPEEMANAAIDRGFRHFIEFFGIDCVGLFEFLEDESRFRLLHHRCAQGTQLRMSRLKPEEFKWTTDQLLHGQTVVVRTRADVPQEAANVMSAVSKAGLRSFAGVPLKAAGRVFGALFFSSSKERDWDSRLLTELQTIANIMGSGLERARARAALTQSEQLKTAILASLPALVEVLDVEGNITMINSSAVMFAPDATFGRDVLLPGVNYFDVCRKAAEQGSQYARTALQGLQQLCSRASSRFEMEYPSGSAPQQRWFHMLAVPLIGKQGGVVVSHTDVTGRKEAELARIEISGRLILAQEEERARIARELHDDINQKLGLLAIDIQQLQQHLPESSEQAQAQAGLSALFDKTNRISGDVQRLSHQLHSSRLDYLGLPAAVRRLCEEFAAQHHIFTECVIRDLPANVTRDINLCLFRVAQECLSNTAKHSGAGRARLELQYEGAAIRMKVSDDGTGFNAEQAGARKEPGLGLISMRERLRLVNGELLIHSRAGAGTDITAVVPVKDDGSVTHNASSEGLRMAG